MEDQAKGLKGEESEKILNGASKGSNLRAEGPESALEMAASLFDIHFEPTPQVTRKSVWPQILACLSAISFHIPVGLVVAYSAILIPQLEAPDSDILVTRTQTSWIASLAVLVVPVGAFLTGYMVDTIGRLNTIKAAAIPYTIGWICIATAKSLPLIYVGRFLTGFAIAMGPSPAVVYTTEVARPDLRGTLICIGPSMTSMGMLLVYMLGALTDWRTIAWMNIAWAFLPIILMSVWSPESPVYLASKGKTERALKSLKYLSRMDNQGILPERQLADILKEQEKKPKSSNTIWRFLTGIIKPTGYKPAIILIMLFFFQQFAGIYITIFYAVTFFQDVGGGLNAYMSTILVGIIRMLVGFLTSYLLRKFGRRPLCIFSGFGMAVTMFITGYFSKQINSGEIEATGWVSWVPVMCVLLYMSVSVIGLMSIPWTMTAELFPLEMRGLCQGLIISIAHVIMFCALHSYRYLTVMLGGAYGVHWLFAAISLVSVVFVWLFLPETHKKKLYEIQDYFATNTVYILRDPVVVAPSNHNANGVI